MLGRDSVTPSVGYLAIKTPHNIKYWFHYLTIVPLAADFTQADVQDNQIYPTITCSSSSLPQGVHYIAAADSGYDDHKLYNLSTNRGFELLVCPVSKNIQPYF